MPQIYGLKRVTVWFMVFILLFLLTLVSTSPKAKASTTISLSVTSSQILLTIGTNQQWQFDKSGSNWGFTHVNGYNSSAWVSAFDNGGKFIMGAGYDNQASSYTVLNNTASDIKIQFSGSGNDAGKAYTWTCTLEATSNNPWVRRTYVLNYSTGGTVNPGFLLASTTNKIQQFDIAGWDPQRVYTAEFSDGLPLILARVSPTPVSSPVFDVAMLMDGSTLATIGNNAQAKDYGTYITLGAVPKLTGVVVSASTNYTVDGYIYLNNGNSTNFAQLAKTATDMYWQLFPYPTVAGYPLTNGIDSWKTAADNLLTYVGTATTDNTFFYNGKGYYIPYPYVDIPNSGAQPSAGTNVSVGALTFAKLTGNTTLYNNVKALNDGLRSGGFLITDGSNDDGYLHDWYGGAGVFTDGYGAEEDSTNQSVSDWKLFGPKINMYQMYKVTGDANYLDNFSRMVAMMSRNLNKDAVNYALPMEFKGKGYPNAYAGDPGDHPYTGWDSGGGEAMYSYIMLLAGKELNNSTYTNLGLNYLNHMKKLPYQQFYLERSAVKPIAFSWAIRALVKAYEDFGQGSNNLDLAEQYAAEMMLDSYFYNFTWSNGGLYNTHPSVGMAHADVLETQVAALEEEQGMWVTAPLLKYRAPDTLLKMYAQARQNMLWAYPKNDAYLGYGKNNAPYYVPYEFMWSGRNGARELYGAGDTFMMYMLYESYGKVNDNQVVTIIPTAVENYQTQDQTFVLYNTSSVTKNVTFNLQNMTNGTYRIILNGVYSNSYSYTTLNTTGISVSINPSSSYRIRAVLSTDGTAPVTPATPTVSSTGDDVASITWTANTEGDMATYEVYRGTVSTFTPDFTNMVGQTSLNSLVDSGLTPSTTYYYKIKAVDTSGNRSGASAASPAATTTANTAPAQVTGLTTSAITDMTLKYKQINTQWTVSTATDLVKYKVYRSISSTFTPSSSTFVGYSYVNYYYDMNLDSGTNYYYMVSAVDRLGNEGTASAIVRGTTGVAGTSTGGDEFSTLSGWTTSTATDSTDGTDVTVTQNGNPNGYGFISKSYTVNLDQSPYLRIKVDGASNQWTLKVYDGTNTYQLDNRSTTGTFIYNVKEATGWSGSKTFSVQLFAIGTNATVAYDWFRFCSYDDEGDTAQLWTNNGGTASVNNGELTVTETDQVLGYGGVTANVKVNLSIDPYITIKVDSTTANWSLKVNNGGGDVQLQGDTTNTGTYTYNLASITGWTGVQSYTLKLYAVGLNSNTKVDYIKAGAFEDHFYTNSGWATLSTSATIGNGLAWVTETDPAVWYGNINKTVSVNLDAYPYIEVGIDSFSPGATWALKLSDGVNTYLLEPEPVKIPGVYLYNVKTATGWAGTKSINIQLWEVNSDTSIGFNKVRFISTY